MKFLSLIVGISMVGALHAAPSVASKSAVLAKDNSLSELVVAAGKKVVQNTKDGAISAYTFVKPYARPAVSAASVCWLIHEAAVLYGKK